jgi:Icc protein
MVAFVVSSNNQELVFIHISDTHLGSDANYVHRGFAPHERTERLVEDIRRLGIRPDFIVHTGDVCGDKEIHATPRHYQHAKTLLAQLPGPHYYLVGNHDCAKSLFSSLEMGPHEVFYQNGEDQAYSFMSKGVTCFSLSSSIPTKREGLLSAPQLEALEARVAATTSPMLFFLHHPPLSIGSPWMDQNMLLQDGEALHRLLSRYRERVLGVFFGHIHQPWQTVRDGISYVSSPGTIFQFSTLPSDVQNRVEPEGVVSYSVVCLRAGQLQVNMRIALGSQRAAL